MLCVWIISENKIKRVQNYTVGMILYTCISHTACKQRTGGFSYRSRDIRSSPLCLGAARCVRRVHAHAHARSFITRTASRVPRRRVSCMRACKLSILHRRRWLGGHFAVRRTPIRYVSRTLKPARPRWMPRPVGLVTKIATRLCGADGRTRSVYGFSRAEICGIVANTHHNALLCH